MFGCGSTCAGCQVVDKAGYSLFLDYPQIFCFADPPPAMGTVIDGDSDCAVRLWLADLNVGGTFP